MRTTTIVVTAALAVLWSSSADAGLVRSECFSTPGGIYIQGSMRILEEGQVRNPPCQGVQRDIRTPVYEIRPTPLAISRGLVQPGVSAEFFREELDSNEPEFVVLVETDSLAIVVICEFVDSDPPRGNIATFYYESTLAGAAAAVEEPNSLAINDRERPPPPGLLIPYALFGHNNTAETATARKVSFVPDVRLEGADDSLIDLRDAVVELNAGPGCIVSGRAEVIE